MVSEALDAISAPFAQFAGVPVQEWSESIGDEFLALGVEVPAQFIFSQLGKALVYLGAGVGLLAARRFIPGMSGRAGRDALELSGHFLNRTVAIGLDPATAALLRGDVQNLKAGLAVGGTPDQIRAAFIKSQAEITAAWDALMAAWGSFFAPLGSQAVFRPVGATGFVGGRPVTGVTVLPSQAGGAEGVIF